MVDHCIRIFQTNQSSMKNDRKCVQLVCYPGIHIALETMALTGKQHEKVQVCENNLVRIIVGIKRADNKKMDELA